MPEEKSSFSFILSHPLFISIFPMILIAFFGWFLGLRDIVSSYHDHVKYTEKLESRIQMNSEKVAKVDNMELRLALLEESNKTIANNMNQTNISVGIMQNDLGHLKSDLSEVKQSNGQILEILTKKK